MTSPSSQDMRANSVSMCPRKAAASRSSAVPASARANSRSASAGNSGVLSAVG
jgi:hypothetical protein